MKGMIPEKLLPYVFDSLPAELTLIDENDTVIVWTRPSPPIFGRPDHILGKDVRDCHPEKSLARVNQLLDDLKSGKMDSEVSLIERPGPDGVPESIRIEYRALRDASGNYLGCLEICSHV